MALLDFYIRNQRLSKAGPQIVADTVNYIDCSFSFRTEDWAGLDKWLVIKKGDEVYNVNLVDDAIPKTAGLNLGSGNWTFSIFGDGEDGSRITTNSVTVDVEASDVEDGEPLPVIELSEAEQISLKVQEALERAKAVEEAAANGEFKGEKGEKGDTGEQGPQGEQGIKGETGPQGPRGEKGEKGDTGEQGPQGEKGEKGDPGKGLSILGYYGGISALEEGVTAPEIGDVYGVGTEAPYNLYSWDGAEWVDNGKLQGAKGEKGDKGETGAQGPQGEQGIQGETGPQGPQGEKGETGETGAQGPQGEKGETGEQGPAGADAPVPEKITGSGSISFTVGDFAEYTYTSVTSLSMAGSAGQAHGLISFGSAAPTVSVTGFSGTGGDDVASAGASEVWEFSCYNGYIIWKKWSA